MSEREIKFLVPETFSLDRVDVGRKRRLTPAGEDRYETVYVDTADLRLAGWGCSLRHRSGQGWTLKLPTTGSGELLDREEIEFPGENARLGPPEELLRLVTAFVRTAGVRPVVRLRTTRGTHRLADADGNAVAEVTLDEVRVEGARPWSFREVEVELAPDTPSALADRMGKRLRAAGATPERLSKYLRALGERAPAGPEVAPIDVGAEAWPGELVRAAFCRSVSRLLVSDPVVRLDGDPEGVHQARVAVRRLRSSLRAFRPYLRREWVVDLRAELKALGGLLGGLRDADVMSARLLDRVETMRSGPASAAEVVRALESRRRRARRDLLRALDEPQYVDLLRRLVAASKAPVLSAGEVPRGSALVQAVLVPPAGRLRTSVGRLGEVPADAALHRVRIDAKGLRYAAEAVGPLAGRSVARLERAARVVQDVLGEHQDAVVAGTWLRARAARSSAPAPWRALERMEIAAADAARAAWPPAWGKLERAMTEAGL